MLNMYNLDLFYLRADVLNDKTHNNDRGDQLAARKPPSTEIPSNHLQPSGTAGQKGTCG